MSCLRSSLDSALCQGPQACLSLSLPHLSQLCCKTVLSERDLWVARDYRPTLIKKGCTPIPCWGWINAVMVSTCCTALVFINSYLNSLVTFCFVLFKSIQQGRGKKYWETKYNVSMCYLIKVEISNKIRTQMINDYFYILSGIRWDDKFTRFLQSFFMFNVDWFKLKCK